MWAGMLQFTLSDGAHDCNRNIIIQWNHLLWTPMGQIRYSDGIRVDLGAGLSDSCLNLDYFSALAIILFTTGLLYRWIKSAVIFTLETHSLYNFQYTLLLKNRSDT